MTDFDIRITTPTPIVGPVSVTLSAADYTGNNQTATATLTLPAPVAKHYPMLFSVEQRDKSESWAQAVIRTQGYGATGAVHYTPGKAAWTPDLQELANAIGDKPLDLQLTFKQYDPAGVKAIEARLPKAWRATTDINLWQEPENDIGTDPAAISRYVADTLAMSDLTTSLGLSAPAPEFMVWSLDPTQHQWKLDGRWLPPLDRISKVFWSFAEYGQKDRIEQMIAWITAWMAKYAPGKPWGTMMCCYTVPSKNPTAAQFSAQAAWMLKAFRLLKAAGCINVSWFDWDYGGIGNAGCSLFRRNPQLPINLQQFMAAA